MSLHNRISRETQVQLMLQRREGALKPLPDSTQEEREKEKTDLINAVNSRDTMFVAGGPFLSSFPPQVTPEIEPKEVMVPLPIGKNMGLLLEDPPGHPIWPQSLPIQSKAVSFEAISYRRIKSGRPASWLLLGPYSIVHFRVTELEEFQLLIQR